MRFSSLIQILQTGDAGLLWSQPGTDPLLAGAASLERAAADQLSFLEKGNALSLVLEESAVGALLLPDHRPADVASVLNSYALPPHPRRQPLCRFPRCQLHPSTALAALHARPRSVHALQAGRAPQCVPSRIG